MLDRLPPQAGIRAVIEWIGTDSRIEVAEGTERQAQVEPVVPVDRLAGLVGLLANEDDRAIDLWDSAVA